MHTLTLRIPDDLWQQLRTEAYRQDRRYNTIISDALLAYFSHRTASCVKTDTPLTEDTKGLTPICVNPDTDQDETRKG